MDTNKILSADLLDIIFDERNKDYGAYELRKTYERRVKKSLFLTGGIAVLTFSSFAFANKFQPREDSRRASSITTITIPPIDDTPPPVIEPPKKVDPPQIKTEKLTNFVIANPDENPDPPPTTDDLKNALIGIDKKDGVDADNTQRPPETNLDGGKNIIEDKKPVEPEIYPIVQIEAKFEGNWEKFLLRNLHGEVPVEKGAPAGRYTVMIQFVVSVDGSVSDIKALTSLGYGLEEEAMRVLRKADKWKPGIQNGREVKSYRRQPITFIVESEN